VSSVRGRGPETVHSDATLVERPVGDRGAAPAAVVGSGSSVRSPIEALYVAEIAQVRLLAVYVLILCALVSGVLHFFAGDPRAKLMHRIGLAIAFASAAWTWWRVRDPNSFRQSTSTLFGSCCSLAVVSGLLYWGPYSAALVAVPIGIYMFAAGQNVVSAWIVISICTAPHAVLAILVAVGALPGLHFVQQGLSELEQLFILVVAQFIFWSTFVLARRVRRNTLDVIAQLEHAVRSVAQREALLDEAKRELDRARQIGGPGRFTGQRVGSFMLGDLLGRGAMGEVYEATHASSGAPAAVKLLTHGAGSDPSMVRRFFREVEIASRLSVPNVVRVLEVPSDEASMPYLAMEKLVGETLSDRQRRDRLDTDEVLDMLRQVAAGISAAHAAGIIHRDLKPGNVFRHCPDGARPVWKILDFGVSKLADQGGTLTQGQIVGTPDYMAPEQARGVEVDVRADVYALGVIAYRALTGRPAFRGHDIPALLYAVAHTMPPRPSSFGMAEIFDDVMAVALAKDPALRFQTAAELAAALDAAARDVVDADIRARAERLARTHPWA